MELLKLVNLALKSLVHGSKQMLPFYKSDNVPVYFPCYKELQIIQRIHGPTVSVPNFLAVHVDSGLVSYA